MTHGFDKEYWEQRWQSGAMDDPGAVKLNPPNPYLAPAVGDLVPGRALDAGCGAGAEAIWLATQGWQVTAADISAAALVRAAERAATTDAAERLKWIEADLSAWEPDGQFDLVMTHYAHPAIPQLEFYDRIAEWVAPGGTLLIVGHLHGHADGGHGHGDGHEDGPPAEASATADTVRNRFDSTAWEIVRADEHRRTVAGRGGHETTLHDFVVRARRR